ncbi:MAG TPA: Holliday junction resolvase RuvX [Usitatibacteraceae bacterium]|nr:Holliday junction resolvase RuvX [Usitatibacteraceae bacterium]
MSQKGDASLFSEIEENQMRGKGKSHLPAPLSGTLLGFDFGEKRLGVAVGETQTRLAHPVAAIAEEATEARFAAIGRLVAEWHPAGFVVGLPRHADGSEHAVARLANKFARRLSARFGLPVAFVDETLTSAEAAMLLREAGGRAKGKGDLDAQAAALILQSYLDDMNRPIAKGTHGRTPA